MDFIRKYYYANNGQYFTISIANEFDKFFSTFSSNSPLDVNDSQEIDLMFLAMKRKQYLITPMNSFNSIKIESEKFIKCFDQMDSY